METVHDSMRRNGLVRPTDDRVLGGVCAGLGRRFGFDAWSARLLFVLILLAIPGSRLQRPPDPVDRDAVRGGAGADTQDAGPADLRITQDVCGPRYGGRNHAGDTTGRS